MSQLLCYRVSTLLRIVVKDKKNENKKERRRCNKKKLKQVNRKGGVRLKRCININGNEK